MSFTSVPSRGGRVDNGGPGSTGFFPSAQFYLSLYVISEMPPSSNLLLRGKASEACPPSPGRGKKLYHSHQCALLTATFSKRRKIDTL